jgi:1-acyl-sn-glycerol-3-phosphate acyltransferase
MVMGASMNGELIPDDLKNNVLKYRLNWLRRLIGTGISFALFGLGGLCLVLTAFPLINLLVRDVQKRHLLARQVISLSFRCFVATMRALGVMRYQFVGVDTLQADRSCLLVANHPTLIDYVLLASVLPNLDCIVKRSLWRNPFLGGVVRAAGYIPNDDGDVLAICEERLRSGGVLLVFPEGTRTAKDHQAGKPLKLERGAANIAARAGIDVRLVHITCEPSTLTKREPWYQIPSRCFDMRVVAQQRIAVQPFLASAPSIAIAARRLTDFLAHALVPGACVQSTEFIDRRTNP